MIKFNRTAVAGLAVSIAALGSIATNEGFSPNPYIPVAGDVPTIGYGQTDGVTMDSEPVTKAEALRTLRTSVSNDYEKAIKRCVKVPLAQGEFDAYVDLAYNIGGGAFCHSTIVKKLNVSDYAGACRGILAWDKFKGHALRGLTNRRRAEYDTCKSPT